MSTLKVLNEVWLFDDSEASNDPEQVRIKYALDKEETLSADFRIDMQLPSAAVTAISLPSGTYNWLYVLVDQEVSIRLSGSTTDEVLVTPSADGVQDGLLLMRGSFTSLSINVAGASAARAFIMAGTVEVD